MGLVVRVTGDNPFTEPKLIDLMVEHSMANQDTANCITDKIKIADGFGSEIFRRDTFLRSLELDSSSESLEHVTVGITAIFLSSKCRHHLNLR
jgi:spore coat polysaccharide biosynthesis protein SpsF (cytidylyltransferase family)